MTGIWGTHVANGAIYTPHLRMCRRFRPGRAGLFQSAADRVEQEHAGRQSGGADRLAEGQSGQSDARHFRHRQRRPYRRLFFQKMTGTKFSFVPYRGLAPAIQDLTAGTIDLMFDTPATSLPQVQAGNIRAYAVTSPKRIASAPDIPTVDEAGLKELYITTWTGFFAPKGTSDEIVAKLGAAARARPSPIPTCRKNSPRSGRMSIRRTSNPRRRWPGCRTTTSGNGGRSSRRPTSRRSDGVCDGTR